MEGTKDLCSVSYETHRRNGVNKIAISFETNVPGIGLEPQPLNLESTPLSGRLGHCGCPLFRDHKGIAIYASISSHFWQMDASFELIFTVRVSRN